MGEIYIVKSPPYYIVECAYLYFLIFERDPSEVSLTANWTWAIHGYREEIIIWHDCSPFNNINPTYGFNKTKCEKCGKFIPGWILMKLKLENGIEIE